jgi:hypothetical protein
MSELEMAKQVYGENGWSEASLARLTEFVNLVRQNEKERIAKKIEQLPFGDTAQSFAIWVRNDT